MRERCGFCEVQIDAAKPAAAKISGFGETESHRIHTIPQSGRSGTVVENMTEMRIAQAAGDSSAHHAEQADVTGFQNIFFGDSLPETRPAGAGVKFAGGI